MKEMNSCMIVRCKMMKFAEVLKFFAKYSEMGVKDLVDSSTCNEKLTIFWGKCIFKEGLDRKKAFLIRKTSQVVSPSIRRLVRWLVCPSVSWLVSNEF